jgi:acyl-CoA reductase-like NAD-dependent aldehyde dehydrogenase
VLTAIPFKDEAEALAIANDVRYGLAGYIWTATSAAPTAWRRRSRPAWSG